MNNYVHNYPNWKDFLKHLNQPSELGQVDPRVLQPQKSWPGNETDNRVCDDCGQFKKFSHLCPVLKRGASILQELVIQIKEQPSCLLYVHVVDCV